MNKEKADPSEIFLGEKEVHPANNPFVLHGNDETNGLKMDDKDDESGDPITEILAGAEIELEAKVSD